MDRLSLSKVEKHLVESDFPESQSGDVGSGLVSSHLFSSICSEDLTLWASVFSWVSGKVGVRGITDLVWLSSL